MYIEQMCLTWNRLLTKYQVPETGVKEGLCRKRQNAWCASREIVQQLRRCYIRLIKWGWLISNCLYARRWPRCDWRVVPR